MNNNPLISIIVPVYNTEKYLDQCLKSIINQTYKNIEIIIINDFSTDNSLKIIEEYVKNYSNVLLINNECNKGVSFSRNQGIKKATGEYIAFIDSDDFIGENYIEEIYAKLVFHSPSIVVNNFYRYSAKGNINNQFKKSISKIDPFFTNKVFDLELYWKNKLIIPHEPFTILFSAIIIKEHNLYFEEDISMGEDLLFIVKYLYVQTNTSVLIDKDISSYYYRKHLEMTSIDSSNYHQLDYLYSKIEEIVKNHDSYNEEIIEYFTYFKIKSLVHYFKMFPSPRLKEMIFHEFNKGDFNTIVKSPEYKGIKKLAYKDFNEFNKRDVNAINPIISIILVVSSADYLEECLHCITNQSYSEIEIIVVDDVANDKSRSIIKEYQENDERISVITNKKSLGISKSKNLGIEIVKGDYICFADSVSTFGYEYIFELYKRFIMYKEVTVISIGYQYFWFQYVRNRNVIKYINQKHRRVDYCDVAMTMEDFWRCKSDIQDNYLSILFSTKIIRDNQIFFENDISQKAEIIFIAKYLYAQKDVRIFIDSENIQFYERHYSVPLYDLDKSSQELGKAYEKLEVLVMKNNVNQNILRYFTQVKIRDLIENLERKMSLKLLTTTMQEVKKDSFLLMKDIRDRKFYKKGLIIRVIGRLYYLSKYKFWG